MDDYHKFNAQKADACVQLPRLLISKRFWQFLSVLLNFVWLSFIEELWFFSQKTLCKKEKQTTRAKRILHLLIGLGPTFIKLGQFLSTRSDILPTELVNELASLQDNVPPFSFALVEQTIKTELSKNISDLFIDFDQKAIASASLGQVHKARLLNGQHVVVKIQRPNLANELYHDIGLMRLIIAANKYVNKLLFSFANERQKINIENHFISWIELSEEFGKTLFKEINYLLEGQNADRMRQVLKQHPDIKIPRIIWKYTTRKILVLEYVGGIKINQVQELQEQGFDTNKIAEKLIGCYLEQFIITGFFHADPHPGNLAIDEYGAIIIYDFGMMGEINENMRKHLFSLVISMVNNDVPKITEALVELKIVHSDANLETISKIIAPFIDYYKGQDLLKLNFDQIEKDLDKALAQNNFRLPTHLAYLIRAGTCLEGIARILKRDFSFIECTKPLLKKWALKEGINQFVKTGQLFDLINLLVKQINTRQKIPVTDKILGSHLLTDNTSNDET
jgi:predicted unusual protein kinase regulating ubiquinone biosynthesis (AarF/ABC1/UbiB family)